ncbi:MAG TPA: hypothetical protein VLC09_12815 [Polyangiaceae bacterium]|nr:hypothetical protein [Polyangiaceae bacterium]
MFDAVARGESLWIEGLRPEALVCLALGLSEGAQLRILFVSPDAELLAQRQHRYSARAAVQFVGAAQSIGAAQSVGAARLGTQPSTLFCHAASLQSAAFQALAAQPIDAIFVEQAQAVSPLAPELRPSLAKAAELAQRLGVPLIAGAPGSTDATAADARERLGLSDACTRAESLGTLSLQLLPEDMRRSLTHCVAPLPRPALVLCSTPAEADAVFAELTAAQLPCHRYHGGLSAKERAVELLQFSLPGRRAILIATSSFAPSHGLCGEADAGVQEDFGRGYGRADLRSLVHVGLPGSLEQLSQELGLLARDGSPEEPGYAIALVSPSQLEVLSEIRARRRPCADTLGATVRALKGVARGAWLEERTLIAKVGGSERATRTALAFLRDGGAIERGSEGGQVQFRAVSLDRLEQVARQLTESFETLRAEDEMRTERLLTFVAAEGCRLQAFARTQGRPDTEACGLCDVCSPEHRVEDGTVLRREREAERRNRHAAGRERASDDEFDFDDDEPLASAG